MIKEFNHDEKKALVAIIKYIIAADGKISEAEVEKTHQIAEEKGLEDFSSIFREVDNEVTSLDDVKKLIHNVREKTHEEDILRIALDITLADAAIDPAEVEIIKIMGAEWNIDVHKLVESLS